MLVQGEAANGIVGWTKRSVPTTWKTILPIDGGHGANAPLPTLRLCRTIVARMAGGCYAIDAAFRYEFEFTKWPNVDILAGDEKEVWLDALGLKRRNELQNFGRIAPREGGCTSCRCLTTESEISPRHCEKHLRRSNPYSLRRTMDCFAALAMTRRGRGVLDHPRLPR
jgi:hypothetical protein